MLPIRGCRLLGLFAIHDRHRFAACVSDEAKLAVFMSVGEKQQKEALKLLNGRYPGAARVFSVHD